MLLNILCGWDGAIARVSYVANAGQEVAFDSLLMLFIIRAYMSQLLGLDEEGIDRPRTEGYCYKDLI